MYNTQAMHVPVRLITRRLHSSKLRMRSVSLRETPAHALCVYISDSCPGCPHRGPRREFVCRLQASLVSPSRHLWRRSPIAWCRAGARRQATGARAFHLGGVSCPKAGGGEDVQLALRLAAGRYTDCVALGVEVTLSGPEGIDLKRHPLEMCWRYKKKEAGRPA